MPRHNRPHGPRRRATELPRFRRSVRPDPADPHLDPRRARASLWGRAATDPHLHYLDGNEMYGEADVERLPLPDQLHPDPATHRLIGQRFAERALGNGGACSET